MENVRQQIYRFKEHGKGPDERGGVNELLIALFVFRHFSTTLLTLVIVADDRNFVNWPRA